jgi:hypothetical protein
MIIRPLVLKKDGFALLAAVKECAPRVEQQCLLPRDLNDLREAFKRILLMPSVETFVAEEKDKLVGAIGVCVMPYMWNPEQLTAMQMFWWASADAPFGTASELFKAVLGYCSHKRAVPVFSAPEEGSEGRARLFKKNRMTPVETTWMGLDQCQL